MTIDNRSNQFHVDNLSYFTVQVTPPRSSGDPRSSKFRRWLKLSETDDTNRVPPSISTEISMRADKVAQRTNLNQAVTCSELSLHDSKRRKLKNWFRSRTRSKESECGSPAVVPSQRFMTFRRPSTPPQPVPIGPTDRPVSDISASTDVEVHTEPRTLPRRIIGTEPARRSNSINSLPKTMPPLKQQMSDPGVRWNQNRCNARQGARYLEEETSTSTNTSSTVCGSELHRSSDTLTSSRSRTRPRNHSYDCCCSRCITKAQNKVVDDVVIIYAGRCPYSSVWAKYIHKELMKDMPTDSLFKIHFRQLEEIIQESSSSQDITDVKTQRRNSVRSARLQIVILSSAFLDITYGHATDEWARLLSPKRVACLLLGVSEAKDLTSLHRAALISYEAWYRIQVGHEDSTSFKKFIATAQKIYKNNDTQRSRSANVPDRVTNSENPSFEVFPDCLGVAVHDALILLEKPLDANDQCSISFSWSDCHYKVGSGDLKRLGPSVLKTSVPNVSSSVDTFVDVSVVVNDVSIGVRKLKYACPLADLKNVLRNASDPLELISAVIQSEYSSRDDLLQIISKLTDLRSGDGIHLLPHPNGIFAINNATGLISPIQEDEEERIGYQIPRPLDMTYLVPPPPKPLPLPKASVKSEKIALVNHNESFDSAYYNLQSPDDSLNEVSASSSCITTIYMPQPRMEASYLNLPPILYNTIQIRQKEALEICGPLAMDTADESFVATENKFLRFVEDLPPPPPPKSNVMRHNYVNLMRFEEKDAVYENVMIRMSRGSDTSRASAGIDSLSLDSDNEKSSVSSDGILAVDELMTLVRQHQARAARALSSSSSQRSCSTPSTSLALSDHEQHATSSGSCSPSPSVTPDSGMSEIQVLSKEFEYYANPKRSSKAKATTPPPPVPNRPPHTLREDRPRLSTFGK